jgi:hypothetical protein
MRPARIDRARRLEFGNSLFVSALRTQDLALRRMRKCAARRSRQGLCSQPSSARNVGRGRISHFIQYATRKRIGQPTLRLLRLRIERKCPIEKADRFRVSVRAKRFELSSPSP